MEFNNSKGELEAAKLPYLPKFKYPSKKAYTCPLPTDSDQERNVYFEFRVTRIACFSKTLHVELSESHFRLIV